MTGWVLTKHSIQQDKVRLDAGGFLPVQPSAAQLHRLSDVAMVMVSGREKEETRKGGRFHLFEATGLAQPIGTQASDSSPGQGEILKLPPTGYFPCPFGIMCFVESTKYLGRAGGRTLTIYLLIHSAASPPANPKLPGPNSYGLPSCQPSHWPLLLDQSKTFLPVSNSRLPAPRFCL